MTTVRGNRVGWVGGALIVGFLVVASVLTTGDNIVLPWVDGLLVLPSPVAPVIQVAAGVVGFFGLGIVILGLIAIVIVSSTLDDQSDSVLGKVAAGIQAGGVLLAVWALLTRFDTAVAMVQQLWYLGILIPVFWVSFVYVRKRQEVASAGTAIDRTRRSIEREIQDVSAVTAGMGVLMLTFVVAFVNGVLSGFAAFGGPLSLWSGEIAFTGLGYLGYLQLGGSGPGQNLVPQLTPIQWVFVVILIGGLALLAGERD